MKIVVIDGYTLDPGDNPWDELGKLGDLTVYDRTSKEQIVERTGKAEIILTNKIPLMADTLEQLPNLRYIGVTATGYNNVDVQTARQRNITVSNVPVYGTDSVAQFVFALLLELCHHVGQHDLAVKNGKWTKAREFSFWETPLVELAGKKMGIIGFGRIGRRVGELSHAFGMEVLAQDIFHGELPAYRPFSWRDVEEVFAEADVVSLHCPQTRDNLGFVNEALLNQMKPTAILINAARGGLVKEKDLASALDGGKIAGAAVDVASAEPIRANNPLLKARNLIITPHIAWATLAARRRLLQSSIDNVRAYLEGNPSNIVN
jgi:glycerate dehydrogenase